MCSTAFVLQNSLPVYTFCGSSLPPPISPFICQGTQVKGFILFCLLPCGDVEPNPGPFPCSFVSRRSKTTHMGFFCEVCYNWNHRACVNMSESGYFHWANIEDGWVCPKCDQEALPFHNTTFLSSTKFSSSHSSQMIVPKINSLRILSFNARSLLPKIYLPRALCLNEPYDILIVTETWLSLDILNSEIRIPGFDIARKDRHQHGGVALYIRDTIPYSRLEIYQPDLVLIICECHIGNHLQTIASFYRPPTQTLMLCPNSLM